MELLLHTLRQVPGDALGLAAAATVGVLLQTRWPAVPGQRLLRPGLAGDLLHSFVNPLIAAPLVIAILHLGGLFTLAPRPHLAALPFAVQAFAAIFLVDFVGYWRHRLLHTRGGWPFHAVHHSSGDLDWLSNDRVEIGELVTTNVIQAASLLLAGFGPEVIALQAVLRRTWGLFIHMNADLRFGPLGYVLVSPTFHRWHHSTDARAEGRNYATFFAGIDWVFGTWFLPAGERPSGLGAPGVEVPEGWVRQVAFPFVNWKRIAFRR